MRIRNSRHIHLRTPLWERTYLNIHIWDHAYESTHRSTHIRIHIWEHKGEQTNESTEETTHMRAQEEHTNESTDESTEESIHRRANIRVHIYESKHRSTHTWEHTYESTHMRAQIWEEKREHTYESAQPKGTWTCHKSQFVWKFIRKIPPAPVNTSIEHRVLTVTVRTPQFGNTVWGKKHTYFVWTREVWLSQLVVFRKFIHLIELYFLKSMSRPITW